MLRKKHILISFIGAYTVYDYLRSGILDELYKEFDLSFVITYKTEGEAELKSYGEVVKLPIDNYWRTRIYGIGKSVWHYYKKRSFVLTDKQRRYRSLISLGRLDTFVVKSVINLKLSKLVGVLIRQLLRITTPNVLPAKESVDLVMMVWGLESLINDDTIRCGRDNNIPVFAVQGGLDSISTKTCYEPPPYAAVWGESCFYSCVYAHGFKPTSVFVVGSPRFESHQKKYNKEQVRGELGLPLEKKIVFFCGTGLPFDEAHVMKTLQKAYDDGCINNDVIIMYRHHPYGRTNFASWEETKNIPFETDFLTVAPSGKASNGSEFYSKLFSASDAVITPYSTMTMEATAYGLPVMCVGYNDDAREYLYDWSSSIYEPHLSLIHHSDWGVVCDDKSLIVEKFNLLVEKIGDEEVYNDAKTSHKFINRLGKESVSDRIKSAINNLVNVSDS
ncbi:MAG: hypothetical protein ACI9IA_000013 [Enterobacterales bacterium]|jgi:hypothetical protein